MPIDSSKLLSDLTKIGNAVVSGGGDLATLNEARNRGNRMATDNQVLTDRATLSPFEFHTKYGTDVQRLLNQADQGQVALGQYMLGADRDGGQAVTDTTIDVATGFNQAVGGIGALATGVVSPTLGVEASKLLNRFVDHTRRNMSPYVKRNEQIEAIRGRLDEQDNAAQFEEDKASNGPLVANLKYLGRDFLDAGKRTLSNPAALKGVVAQGTGSLLAAGPTSKVLQGAGLAAKAVMPVAIGLMEGGGAYTGSTEDIMSRSHDELMQSSSYYRDRIAAGDNPEDVKTRIAHNAGMVAAAIQGPLGAAIGKVTGVGGFEAAPLAAKPLREAGRDMMREMIEEAAQGFTGQISQNVGTKIQADPQQRLLEGAGAQTALGAIGGLGAAGVVQAPRLGARAAAAPVKMAADAVRQAGVRAQERLKADSPVSDSKLNQDLTEQVQAVPQVAEALTTLATEAGAKGVDAEAYIARVTQATELQQEEFTAAPDAVKERLVAAHTELGRIPNRFEALQVVGNMANDETASEAVRTSAGIFLINQIENNKKLFNEDLPDFVNQVPHDRAEYQTFDKFRRVLEAIETAPQIKQALDWAREQMQVSDEAVSSLVPGTPEARQTVDNAVGVALHNPTGLSEKVLEGVLKQADEGLVELNPTQRKILEGASALLKVGRLPEAKARLVEPQVAEDKALPQAETETGIELVSRQIETNGGNKSHQWSLKKHVQEINKAVAAGDKAGTKAQIEHLGRFAQSMINKLEAFNTAIQNGDRKDVPYSALGPDGSMLPADGFHKVYFNPGTAASEKLARQVAAETAAVIGLANEFARQHPEFGIGPIAVPTLNLQGNAQTINKDNAAKPVADIERGSSTAANSKPKAQATTAKPKAESKQLELPLPPPAPVREPEPAPLADQATQPDSTTESGTEVKSEPATAGLAETVTDSPAATDPQPTREGEVAAEAPAAAVLEDNQPDNIENTQATKPAGKSLDIVARFPKLIATAGKNMFHRAFRLPKEQNARLIDLANPLADLKAVLRTPASIKAYLGFDPQGYTIGVEQRDAVLDLLGIGDKMVKALDARLEAALNKQPEKEGSTSLRAQLKAESPRVLRYRQTRVLNLLGENLAYDRQLLETAVFAGLDWVLNAPDRIVPMDDGDVASLLGSRWAPADLVTRFQEGESRDMAVRNLAQHIQSLWGLETNKDADISYTRGIPEALAGEILFALEMTGMLAFDDITAPEYTNKTFGRVLFANAKNPRYDMIKTLRADKTRKFLADLALKKPQPTGRSVGKPVEEVARMQLRNPMVKLSRQARRAVEALQATEFKPNLVVVDFVTALGRDNYNSLMGGRRFEKDTLNVNHQRSVEGKNLTLDTAFDRMDEQMRDIHDYAKTHSIPVEEVATHYEYQQTKVGRLQMMGLFNPQADKLAREVFMATRATIDLSSKDTADYGRFLLAVGQALNVSTDKLTRAEVVAAVEAMTAEGGELHTLFQDLVAWTKERSNGKGKALSEELVDRLKAARPKGKKLSMHGVHALLALAQYQHGVAAGADLSQFTTSLYLEADGKTNGPINALMLFARGVFTPEYLEMVAKGGAFIGDKNRTLNQHARTKDGKFDLYGTLTALTQAKLADRAERMATYQPELHDQYLVLRRFLAGLNIDVQLIDGDLVIDRGFGKSPLTITVYGSGMNGIAGNIAGELVDTIYEKLSETMRTGEPIGDLIYGEDADAWFKSDLNTLFAKAPHVDRNTGEVTLRRARKSDDKDLAKQNHARTYTVTPQQFKALQDNVKHFIVEPMIEALDEHILGTGKVRETTAAIQKASQLQSIVLKALFTNQLKHRLAAKKLDPERHDFHASEFFSEKELEDIRKTLLPFSPIIDTGTQAYMLSGAERGDVIGETVKLKVGNREISLTMPESFGTALFGHHGSPAYVFAPTYAGVKAVPTVTIGSGDGQMALNNATADPEHPARTLQTFDGVSMPIDALERLSLINNQSVHSTWNANPVRAVADSFAAFMRANPLEKLLEDGDDNTELKEALLEFGRVIENKYNDVELATPAEVAALLADTTKTLATIADEIDARQRVLRKAGMSVDQMAGAETAYTHPGSIEFPEGAAYADKAKILNEHYERELRNQAKEKSRPAIETRDQHLAQVIEEYGQPDDTGVTTLPGSRLGQLLDAMRDKLSETQQALLDAVGTLDDWTVVVGDREQVDAWERLNHPDRHVPSKDDYYGKADPVSKVITVINVAAETFLHELVHVATLAKVKAYYENPQALSPQDREAIGRIDKLLDEWMTETYEYEDAPTQDAHRQARATINGYFNQNQRGAAVNEFMAWVLANQNLARVADKTTVRNPLARIVGKVLKALKKLVWGDKPAPFADDSILSNLRFNTQVLMATATPAALLRDNAAGLVHYHSPAFGSSDYLTKLRQTFHNKVVAYIGDLNAGTNAQTALARRREWRATKAEALGQEMAGKFALAFPNLQANLQAFSTFATIQQALAVDVELNPNALIRVEELYTHAVRSLTVESLMVDPDLNDPNDRSQAQDKLNTLQGVGVMKTDPYGRSTLMASFLALALTDENFRGVLAKLELPKAKKNKAGTLDAALENLGHASFARLGRLFAGEKRSDTNVRAALDSLVRTLTDSVGDQRAFIEQAGENKVDGFEGYLANRIQLLADTVATKAEAVVSQSKSKLVRGAARVALVGASVVHEGRAKGKAQGIMAALNQSTKTPEFIRSLARDLLDPNVEIADMISKVRAWVSQTRQRYREEVPELVREKFKRKLSKQEWSTLTRGLGFTDLAALFSQHGLRGSLEIISDNTKLNGEISNLETAIRAMDPKRWPVLKDKATQLAWHMVSGEHQEMLLSNARAVAHLFGEPGHVSLNPDAKLVEGLDKLITLYALKALEPETQAGLASLAQEEADGVGFVLSYLNDLRTDELSKISGDMAAINHFKGHLPFLQEGKGTMIIASDTEYDKLAMRGYVRVQDYNGSSADRTLGSRGYYFSPVNGRAPFRQGIMQTVHRTVGGVDPQTGFTVGAVNAGRITDARQLHAIQLQLGNAKTTTENLRPVFDGSGKLIAFERMADANVTQKIERNMDLAELMGAWRGRQEEERLAASVNKQLVERLFETWDTALKSGKRGQFVNLARLRKADDPVLHEAWRLVPDDTKALIAQRFGSNQFWVRRDMVDDALGFRQASVGDLFTGEGRWKKGVETRFQDLAYGLFGMVGKERQAYHRLIATEQFVQGFVGSAKDWIVVKSVIVPVANMMANMVQLTNRGVPLRKIVTGLPAKAVELNFYIKARQREIALEAELSAARGRNDTVQIRKLRTELTAIHDDYKRLSIAPLIQAGMFSAITNGRVTAEDLALANGRWGDHVEKLASKLPGPLKTIGRYGLITHDTALYQGLAQAVQYGDFLARAVLYDDLAGRKKLSQKDAIAQVNAAFIDYNRSAGRTRQYAESVGLIWFWNFKLRAVKEAAYTLRHHPLRSLLLLGLPDVPGLGDIGSPVEDNFWSALADGRLGYSIGPSMGLHSFGLNPWVNLAR